MGRRPKLSEKESVEVCEMHYVMKMSVMTIARVKGVSETTVYNVLNRLGPAFCRENERDIRGW